MNNIKLPFYVRISILLIGLYAVVAMLYITQEIVIPVIFGTMIAIVLHPVVSFFIRKKMSRIWAITLTLFLMFLLFLGFGFFLFSQISLFSESFPALIERFTSLINHSINWAAGYFDLNPDKINKWINQTTDWLINMGSAAVGQTLVTMGNALVLLFLIPVYVFMILYYRLPGIVAVMALSIYAVVTYALYRTIPITLTLPGIAGLMLSTGAALDANILIFERMKEELRSGKPLRTSISQGFTRAWSSIRDSNLATILVAMVLWFFGGQSGATIVIGFAFTLLVGVIVSLFTALFVTRTLLDVVLNAFEPENKTFWFGL